jgi:hypothetical protein
MDWVSKLQGRDHTSFSLDRNAGPMYNVLACVVIPLAVTIASVYVTGSHFWRTGTTRRWATFYGTMLIVLWGLVWWGGSLIGVDHKEVVDRYLVCVVGDNLALGIIEDRKARMVLERRTQWGSLGGMVW